MTDQKFNKIAAALDEHGFWAIEQALGSIATLFQMTPPGTRRLYRKLDDAAYHLRLAQELLHDLEPYDFEDDDTE